MQKQRIHHQQTSITGNVKESLPDRTKLIPDRNLELQKAMKSNGNGKYMYKYRKQF